MKHGITSALTGAVIGLAVLALGTLSGCAQKKPVLNHPVAQLVIPVSCIDGVVGGTKEVICEQLADNAGEAVCKGGVIVKFHCTKSLPK